MIIRGKAASNYPPRWVSLSAPACIAYAVRNQRASLAEAVDLWRRARRSTRLGRIGFLGRERDVPAEFFTLLADKMYDECITYRCVEGCCSVLWHPRLGNKGGYGIAGCPCDLLDDPRDLALGPIG